MPSPTTALKYHLASCCFFETGLLDYLLFAPSSRIGSTKSAKRLSVLFSIISIVRKPLAMPLVGHWKLQKT